MGLWVKSRDVLFPTVQLQHQVPEKVPEGSGGFRRVPEGSGADG